MNVIDQFETEKYSIYNADCVEVARSLPDESIDFSQVPPLCPSYPSSTTASRLHRCWVTVGVTDGIPDAHTRDLVT